MGLFPEANKLKKNKHSSWWKLLLGIVNFFHLFDGRFAWSIRFSLSEILIFHWRIFNPFCTIGNVILFIDWGCSAVCDIRRADKQRRRLRAKQEGKRLQLATNGWNEQNERKRTQVYVCNRVQVCVYEHEHEQRTTNEKRTKLETRAAAIAIAKSIQLSRQRDGQRCQYFYLSCAKNGCMHDIYMLHASIYT